MTSPDDHPFDRSTDPSRAPFSGKVSLDFGIASLGMGLLVGARFPLLALLLGVSAAQALRPLFYGVCLAAGLVIGAAGWLLGRRIVGRRVGRLAARTAWLTQVVAPAAHRGIAEAQAGPAATTATRWWPGPSPRTLIARLGWPLAGRTRSATGA